MKAQMEMRVDTTWGNQIIISVDAELDNPSLLTTREIAALMIHSLGAMLAEVRLENDRHERSVEVGPPGSDAEREQVRFHEMERTHGHEERRQ